MRSLASLRTLALGLTLGCGSGIKSLPPADDTGPADAADSGAADGEDGADGADGGGDGGDGGTPTGSVDVEYTVLWRIDGNEVEVCSGALSATEVTASWSTWGVWTDIDPDLDEPAPDPLPDPISALSPVGQGTTAGHGSWRFSHDSDSDPNFDAYAARLQDGEDHRLVCVLSRDSDETPQQLESHRPLPDVDGVLEGIDVRLRVIWDEG